MKKLISILLTLTLLMTTAFALAEEINVISREDGSGTRGAFIELFGIEQKNEAGEKITEKVPVGCAHYERIYDSLVDAIENGAAKCVKDEEVVKVLEILEEATEVAKSWKK